MQEIYLDSAATTRVSERSAAAAMQAMAACWGNPSSGHSVGLAAEQLVRTARSAICSELGAREEELYFTSGGTEANNLAIFGAARTRRRTGGRVITCAAEHSSVVDSVAALEKEGFEVVMLPPNSFGGVDLAALEAALSADTILLSFMLVNNETGAINPIKDISRMLKRHKLEAHLHCDAVQAFGKLKVSPKALGCDTLSLSGHKLHAPKGIGALWKKKEARLIPLMYGGSQQNGLRPGTEPVPLIAALGEAVRSLPVSEEQRLEPIRRLNGYLLERLTSAEMTALAPITISSPSDGAPHVLSFATGCIKSETMLNYLSANGIFVSAGSACSKGRASHVLQAMALPQSIAQSTIRVSFCSDNTTNELDIFTEALKRGLATLARFR